LRILILENEIKSVHASLEERVRARTLALQKAVDELNGFTYSVSHDLRAPLRAMVGYSRIILEEYTEEASSGLLDKLRRIESNALRMANLVDDLLAYARLGRQELQTVSTNLTALAHKCANTLIQQGWPCEGLALHVQEGMVAQVDPVQIEILLTILIENGCKYRIREEPAEIWISAVRHPDQMVVEVRNRGIGFDNKFLDRIFRPFERLHRDEQYPGTGIGLANASRIVERHGGSIWADGRPGEGASFFFSVPAPRRS
jgi:light-regulated signal transduction histidine kinase (bacteriophytochrome)